MPKTHVIGIRVTEQERLAWQIEAAKAGVSLSEWVRGAAEQRMHHEFWIEQRFFGNPQKATRGFGVRH